MLWSELKLEAQGGVGLVGEKPTPLLPLYLYEGGDADLGHRGGDRVTVQNHVGGFAETAVALRLEQNVKLTEHSATLG